MPFTLADGLTAVTQQARFCPIIQEVFSELRHAGGVSTAMSLNI